MVRMQLTALLNQYPVDSIATEIINEDKGTDEVTCDSSFKRTLSSCRSAEHICFGWAAGAASLCLRLCLLLPIGSRSLTRSTTHPAELALTLQHCSGRAPHGCA
eukprot:365093-Chlamydomonas_euryale.AAC.9